MEKRRKNLERDSKALIWHPFTQMREWESGRPLIIEKARGVFLIDIHGRRFYDGTSSIWVNLHGHGRPEINRALSQQLSRVAHSTLLGLSNVPAIELARRLIALAPRGLSRVFYSDNGSTAVEVALKMAVQYWQLEGKSEKTGFVTLVNAYHGDTVGGVSLGGIDLFHERFRPLLFSTQKVGAPYCYRCFLNKRFPSCALACADELETVVSRDKDRLAAVVVEPMIQGAAGMLMWPEGYLRRVREICSRHDVLMIADEVLTGFGRTGRMFACNHEGVTPDLMALAKGLTGGYLPLAATLTTDRIYQSFLGRYDEFKTFFHGHSYTGNQLGCAAALANLDLFRKGKVLQGLQSKIRLLQKELSPLRDHPNVGEVRFLGFIAALELVRDRGTKAPFPLAERRGQAVALEAQRRGMLIRPLGNVIALMPPLSATRREISAMCRILRDSVSAALPEGESTRGSS